MITDTHKLANISIPKTISKLFRSHFDYSDRTAINIMSVLLFNAKLELEKKSSKWITSYSYLKKHSDTSYSTIYRKLILFTNLGFISKKIKTISKNGKVWPVIELTFTEKFYKNLEYKSSTKTVDKIVHKYVNNNFRDGQNESHTLYIDNIIKTNNISKVERTITCGKLSDFYPLASNVCDYIRKKTNRYFKNTVINEVLRSLSLKYKHHTFKSLKHFLTYFEKAIKFEKRQEKEVNSRKKFFINAILKENAFRDSIKCVKSSIEPYLQRQEKHKANIYPHSKIYYSKPPLNDLNNILSDFKPISKSLNNCLDALLKNSYMSG